MRRSIQALLIAASIAAFACAPKARANITTCDSNTESALRKADNSAIFGVSCSIALTQGPLQMFAVTLSGGNTPGVIDAPPGATQPHWRDDRERTRGELDGSGNLQCRLAAGNQLHLYRQHQRHPECRQSVTSMPAFPYL